MAIAGALAAPAAAELRVCNSTERPASAAIGYFEDEVWVSEGWWRVEPAQCTVTLRHPLDGRFYYWRAVNADGAFADQGFFFCTADGVFTIRGDTGCAERGYDRLPFSEIDTGPDITATVTLKPEDAPAPRAGTTGDPREAPMAGLDGAREPGPEDGRSRLEARGIFSHCDAGDCLIVADGRRLLVGSGRAQLLGLRPNTPIALVGRLHSRGDTTDRIALASFEELSPDAFGDIRAMLQGRWQDLRQPDVVFDIAGAVRQDLLTGEPVFEAFFEVADTCSGAGSGPALRFTYYTGGTDRVCWQIRLLEADTLVVSSETDPEERVFLRVE